MRRFRRTRRAGDDRGIALLEFAIVMPFLMVMLFGTAEMGLAWVAHNRVEGAVSTAARVGASTGADANADVNILVALRAALPPEALANLDRAVIFKPSDANGTIPSGCIKTAGSTSQSGVSGACNSYAGATVRSVTTSSDLGTTDDSWVGTSRKDSLADPPDYIGVYIRTTYNSKTGSFFNDMTITRTSIYRIQPDIDG